MRPKTFVLLATGLACLAGPALARDSTGDSHRFSVLAAVDELRGEVARIRGLPWKRTVEAELLTRDELKEKLDHHFREDLDQVEYEKTVRALRRYGMLREDQDLLALFKGMMQEGILAYYDPDTTKIYVVLGPELDALRPTIFHELVHALEDQHVGIRDAQEAVDQDTDRSFALSCVVEGSAERGRVLWEVAHPGLARRARLAKEDPRVAAGMKTVLDTIPAYLIVPIQFHYQRGIAFVERVVGNDYVGGMERLYREPPETQEQILHPQRYLGSITGDPRRDLPRRIEWRPDLPTVAGRGWEMIDDEGSGELDFGLWFDFFLGRCGGLLDMDLLRKGQWCTERAARCAEGWDGARTAFLRKAGEPLAIVEAAAWDTPHDAREAAGATVDTLRARYGSRFQGGEWAYAGGYGTARVVPDQVERTYDYVADGQRGRILVAGDTLLWLEALPPDVFERVWEALRWTTFERDTADRWEPSTARDPLVGATWRSEEFGVGWRSPLGWSVERSTSTTLTARKEDVSVELTAVRGSVQQAFLTLPLGLQVRVRNGQVEPEETTVRGRSAARLTYDTGEDADGRRTRHVVVLIEAPQESVLVLVAKAPVSAKPRFAVEVEEAIDGVLVRE